LHSSISLSEIRVLSFLLPSPFFLLTSLLLLPVLLFMLPFRSFDLIASAGQHKKRYRHSLRTPLLIFFLLLLVEHVSFNITGSEQDLAPMGSQPGKKRISFNTFVDNAPPLKSQSSSGLISARNPGSLPRSSMTTMGQSGSSHLLETSHLLPTF
jgi:hypothetical protein